MTSPGQEGSRESFIFVQRENSGERSSIIISSVISPLMNRRREQFALQVLELYLLRGVVSVSIVAFLSEDDVEHSMWAAARLIHVGGSHSPAQTVNTLPSLQSNFLIRDVYSDSKVKNVCITWPCCQSPSGPGCHCRRWQLAWIGPLHRVPSEDVLEHAGSLCFWGSVSPAHVHSRFPCSSPVKIHPRFKPTTQTWNVVLNAYGNEQTATSFHGFITSLTSTEYDMLLSVLSLIFVKRSSHS